MKILLFVLGLLALSSGGLKFRDRIMNRIGTSPFALGELGLGLVACASAIFLADGTVIQAVIAALTLASVLVASVHQSKLTTAFRRRRELSESHRLQQFLEHDKPGRPGPATVGDHNEA